MKQHCGLTAVRNRLRSQTPPTHFHTVIHCVLTLPLCESRSRFTVHSFSFCLTPAHTGGYLYHPLSLKVTILTLASPNQLNCVCEGNLGLRLISVKQTQLCLFGIWTSVRFAFLQRVKIIHQSLSFLHLHLSIVIFNCGRKWHALHNFNTYFKMLGC